MATVITPTLVGGPVVDGIGTRATFTLLLGTTSATGEQTLDLTDWFKNLHSVEISGSLASTGYVVEVGKPALATALTGTNLILTFYEAGADAAALDYLNSVDLSAVITGLTVVVTGKPAAVASWA